MNRSIIIGGAAIVAVAVVAGGFALAHGGWRGHHPHGGARFVDLATFDLDKDGKITRAEIDQGAQAQFAKADANGDGKLDPQEAKVMRDAARAAWKANNPNAPTRGDRDKGEEKREGRGPRGGDPFKKVDWNLDGGLTFDEFVQPIRAAAAGADHDADGSISVEDLKKGHGRHGGRHHDRGGENKNEGAGDSQ